MASIDLNSDLGEGFGPWRMGDDDALMDIVTSVNIACGGHAGDHVTMTEAVSAAHRAGLGIGAHPSFVDKQGFGRRAIPTTPREVERLVATQVGALCGAAALAHAEVTHVKPHGALSNLSSVDPDVADAVARASRAVDDRLVLLAAAGTRLDEAGRRAGLRVAREGFADRAYTPDGLLAPRGTDGAVIHDAEEAAGRAVAMAEGRGLPLADGSWRPQEVDSVCVHGDTPGALTMARATRTALEQAGFTLVPFRQTLA